MKEVTIQLTEAQWKAMEVFTPEPAEWAEGAVTAYADRCIEQIFSLEVERMLADGNISFIPADKEAVVLASELPTAKEVNASVEANKPW
jgi:hypothetical protein